MTNFTLGNHLVYSIGNRRLGYRKTSIEKYQVSIGKIDEYQYLTSNYYNELIRTADSVYKELGKDLVVFLSGGTDSEIVVRNFIDIGIKPRCVTIEFKDGYNAPDVVEAEAIACDLGLALEKIPFDIKNFFYSGEAKEFGETIQCSQITYLMVYHSILKYNFPAVMGGEALFTRNVTTGGSSWYYTFRENEDASAMRFSEKYNIPLVNEWFSYTPELLLYYMEDWALSALFADKYNYKLSSVSSKNAILRRLCPNIRPKIKTHGFERLLGFNNEAYKAIASDQVKRLEPSLDGIPVNTLIKMLKGEI
jgi:hypothetical protein